MSMADEVDASPFQAQCRFRATEPSTPHKGLAAAGSVSTAFSPYRTNKGRCAKHQPLFLIAGLTRDPKKAIWKHKNGSEIILASYFNRYSLTHSYSHSIVDFCFSSFYADHERILYLIVYVCYLTVFPPAILREYSNFVTLC